jgi:hypothetical protein
VSVLTARGAIFCAGHPQEKTPGEAVVHAHTSVPFYMDGSLRPAFDLQP